MDLTLLFILAVLLGQEVTGLKLLGINVPAYSLRGKSALLECRYDLETDKLYSITWYKDHEEFYRYVPKGEPKKHTYHVEGVKVDYRRSDHQQVLLQNVSLYTSGKYKCEVITEAPSFNAINAEANMEIVGEARHGDGVRAARTLLGDIQFTATVGTESLRWRQNKRQMRGDRGIGFKLGRAAPRDSHNGSFRKFVSTAERVKRNLAVGSKQGSRARITGNGRLRPRWIDLGPTLTGILKLLESIESIPFPLYNKFYSFRSKLNLKLIDIQLAVP
ncbi:uncharacterized protein LOC107999890 isoform X5 [Apis cerana]|uniref:uncharacterized protein LOC107999890 isoform X5 n=1 Tax=Apis cerana TaxID=7461 RepID=UPI002B23648B|nr:uncharacterized protein LOC107999890 isoform X5 [Apis cerana]XP_061941023.1 uncharacterized protein LOC107999890 isoform X5 [Apis cerana]